MSGRYSRICVAVDSPVGLRLVAAELAVVMAVRLGWMLERRILVLVVELTVHLSTANHERYTAFV